ncbi:MAG: hypothetical protein BJ554DRAFT_977 [Olpidium bornovanus]|uniref:Disease resistance R13L4/SHOC-2-like LRR domain-containing protein n=1 Tax=Olpidium bornovanus TaxID=278681 RepID=A0A8H7ZT43_9FUNG|nr:MAG: hypothetical protein BJ554DRAFT_977 [Olpidium bornovanus]
MDARNTFNRLCMLAEHHACVLWFLEGLTTTHKFAVKQQDGAVVKRNLTFTAASGPGLAAGEAVPLPAVRRLSGVRILHLQGNQLRFLPPTLFQLTGLEELNLGYNSIERLDRGVGQLRRLRELLLHGNRLEQLPQEVGQLQRLEVLDLSGNRLRHLPAEIARLRRLRMIWCDDNRFQPHPPGASGAGADDAFRVEDAGGELLYSAAESRSQNAVALSPGGAGPADLRVYHTVSSILNSTSSMAVEEQGYGGGGAAARCPREQALGIRTATAPGAPDAGKLVYLPPAPGYRAAAARTGGTALAGGGGRRRPEAAFDTARDTPIRLQIRNSVPARGRAAAAP